MSVTIKDLLQELLDETQKKMNTYHQLSDKKKKERKIMEAYRYLQYKELHLMHVIKKFSRKEGIIKTKLEPYRDFNDKDTYGTFKKKED